MQNLKTEDQQHILTTINVLIRDAKARNTYPQKNQLHINVTGSLLVTNQFGFHVNTSVLKFCFHAI